MIRKKTKNDTIIKLSETQNYYPLKHQLDIHQSKNKMNVLIGGYGSGKSLTAAVDAILYAYNNPGSNILIVSPNYLQARRTVLEHIIQILDSSNIKYTYNKSTWEFKIKSSKIWIASGDRPESLKGSNISLGIIDEPFIQDKAVYEQVIARLRQPGYKHKLLLTGTPEGLSSFGADLIQNNPDWNIIRASTYENKYLDTSYVNNLLEQYSSEMIQAYVYGQFVSMSSNLAYYCFSKDNVISKDLDRKKQIIISLDWNVNPLAGIIVQQDGDIDYIIDEIYIKNATIEKACYDIDKKYKGMSIVLTGDPTGKNSSLYSPYGNFEQIRKILPYISIRIPQIWKVIDSLNLSNSRLCNSLGQRKVFINPNCKNLIRDFERVLRLPDGSIDKKSDLSLSHISDSYRYYCNEFRAGQKYRLV